MKRWVFGLAAFAVLAASALAQPSAPDRDAQAADRALADALRAGDKAAAEDLLHRRFMFVDRRGNARNRDEFLSTPAASAPDANTTVRSYGRVVAMSTETSGATVLRVWVKRKTTWRALVIQETPTPQGAAPPPPMQGPQSAAPSPDAPSPECDNPCKSVPYTPRTADQQEVVAAFQAIERAVTSNDADTWVNLVTDDFIVYRTRAAPIPKAERIPVIRRQKEAGAVTAIGRILSMNVWAYADAAVMTAYQEPASGSGPKYRVTRLFVKRDGRWQMALSQQTTIEP